MSAEQVKNLNNRVSNLEKAVHRLEARAPGEQHEAGASPKDTSKDKSHPAGGKLPLLPQVPPAPRNTPKPDKSWHKTLQGWKALLEIAAIPFAILYAVVTWFQWHDLHIEQRAWIKAVLDWNQFPATNKVPIQLFNVGKSPAKTPHMITRMEIVPSKSPPSFVWKFLPHLDDEFPFDFPGDSHTAEPSSLVDTNLVARKLTDAEAMDIADGKAYVAVFGFVIYSDQFGEHWTRFCTWRAFSKQYSEFTARPCVQWNAVGDGKSPDE